jgi:mono/diheme cytochrome c family protein
MGWTDLPGRRRIQKAALSSKVLIQVNGRGLCPCRPILNPVASKASQPVNKMSPPARNGNSGRKIRRIVDLLMIAACLLIAFKVIRPSGAKNEQTASASAGAAATSGAAAMDARPHVAGYLMPSGAEDRSGDGAANTAEPFAPERLADAARDIRGTVAVARPSRSQMDRGKRVYVQACLICHQPDGEGLSGVFPPLAQSDYLMADKERSIRIVLNGQIGEIIVNGKRYNGVMPPILISDEQIASVLTYVRNSWGNSGEPVTVDEVRRIRGQLASNSVTVADGR